MSLGPYDEQMLAWHRDRMAKIDADHLVRMHEINTVFRSEIRRSTVVGIGGPSSHC